MPVSALLHRAGNVARRIESRLARSIPQEADANRSFEPNVLAGLDLIRKTSLEKLRDAAFLEFELLPAIGLNGEMRHEQPRSLHSHLDKGFGWRIWQYPNQFAQYLIWLSREKIDAYLEIGCRFGGTFVLTSEYLSRFNPAFAGPVAVDLMEKSELLRAYDRPFDYFCGSSQSEEFQRFIRNGKFDLALIDGDHSFLGVFNDFKTVRWRADRIVLHDITSVACPDIGNFWLVAKTFLEPDFTFLEFTDQYSDTPAKGPFLGIGVMKRT